MKKQTQCCHLPSTFQGLFAKQPACNIAKDISGWFANFYGILMMAAVPSMVPAIKPARVIAMVNPGEEDWAIEDSFGQEKT